MIIDRVYAWARERPDKTALIQNGVPVTYASFARAIERTRKYLESQQLPEGTTAAVLIDDLATWWTVGIAARAVGLTTAAGMTAEQVQALNLRNLSCFVLFDDDILAEKMPPVGTRLVVVPRSLYDGLDHDDIPAPIETEARYGGHIISTSGTTGTHKKILFPPALEDKRNARRAEVYGIDRNFIINSIAFRPATGSGAKQPSAAWHAGATVVFDQTKDWAANLFRFGAGRATIVPLHVQQILSPQAPPDDPARELAQGTLAYTGGFLSPVHAERLVREVTPRLMLNFSSSETIDIPLSSIYRTTQDLIWLAVNDGCRVEIVDASGRLCGAGEEGRLRIVLKDTDASGYLDDPEATARAFRDGCFYPGDMAVSRADGRIRILGRVHDVINLRGEKFAVGPVEQDLCAYLGVDDVCLFMHASDDGEETLVVAIQASTPPTPDQVARVRQEFHFVPRLDVRVLAQFPRGGHGKVQRATLNALLRGAKAQP